VRTRINFIHKIILGNYSIVINFLDPNPMKRYNTKLAKNETEKQKISSQKIFSFDCQ